MIKYEAIGVIEIQYFTFASEILDSVCKGANVKFLSAEKYLGGRLVSLIVGGSVSDIKAAIEIAKEACQDKPGNPLKMALAITNPHEEIMRYIVPFSQEAMAIEAQTPVETDIQLACEQREDGSKYGGDESEEAVGENVSEQDGNQSEMDAGIELAGDHDGSEGGEK